jgi:hypothetical protein
VYVAESLEIVAMTNPEQIDTFDAATIAFEIRFERELTSRWQRLESETRLRMTSSPSAKKRPLLDRFFRDVQEEIGRAVHEYFPKLLHVATTYRERIGNQSPLTWTQAQVLMQSCNLLGMEEKFDPTSPPGDQSLVLGSAARIATGVGWLDDVPADFVLPGWVQSRWGQLLALGHSRNDSEPLSRTETLEWVKRQEFWISKRLELQIDNESWDGLIEAGKNGVSVLETVASCEEQQSRSEAPEKATEPSAYSFVREATTWSIKFEGETCRLPHMLGLAYLSVLLQNPGKPMRGLELQNATGGLPFVSRSSGKLVSDSLADDSESEDAENKLPSSQNDFSRVDVLDDEARQQVEARLLEIEKHLAYKGEIQDIQGVDALQKEYSTLESYLGSSRNIHRRPRVFANENEKARTSITNALKRAYSSIRVQAPKTASYLESNIKTGSEFMFRDGSTSWNIRRTP